MNKRDFIKKLSGAGLLSTGFLAQMEKLVAGIAHRPPAELAADEDFWAKVRSGYRLKPDYINLENGY